MKAYMIRHESSHHAYFITCNINLYCKKGVAIFVHIMETPVFWHLWVIEWLCIKHYQHTAPKVAQSGFVASCYQSPVQPVTTIATM